jgi:hypothetical protein
MEHAALVGRREAGTELAGHVDGGVVRQPADPAQQRRQVLPVDELHGEERVAAGLADVVDAADVGMRDIPRHPHLGPESFDAIGVRRDGVGQELERDRLAEHQVLGAIDVAHPAAADERDDAIPRGEQGPRREATLERGPAR